MMKAYPLRAISKIHYENVEDPECPSGWSIIKVRAAGICSSDIPRIFKKGTYHFPTIPGHEFSGVVHKVADKEDKTLLGRKVGVFPLIPCHRCEQCRRGKYEMCSNYDYVGSRRDGGFAEYVAVPVWNLIELPDDISFEEAAMMEPLSVSLHAAKRLHAQTTDDVAIIGTGMIAFASAQWLLNMGAKSVTILGRSEEKKKIAETIPGLQYMELKDCKQEFDSVLEAVGSNQTISAAITLAKPGGKIVMMGNPEGSIELSQDTYWRILRRQLHVTGSWNSSYDGKSESDWTEVREALAEHKMHLQNLISHRFSQEQLPEALALMYEHKEPYCKIMTIWGEKK